MAIPTISGIGRRVSANRFDAAHAFTDAEITELVRLATRAPTAYNLQTWRFIAVRTAQAKARLRALGWNQAREFGLTRNEIPALRVAVGRAAPGNWPQKRRRPLAEVLEIS